MSDDEATMHCRAGTLFGIGLSVGVVIGIAVGSVVVLRLGVDAVDTIRGFLDRVSGRNNQVNFELLLQ
jgi:hypothetical protein